MSTTSDLLMSQLNEAYAEFRVNPAIDFEQPEAAAQAALWQLVIALAATTLPRKKPTRPLPPDAREALDRVKAGHADWYSELCGDCAHEKRRHMFGGGCADCEKWEPEHARCTLRLAVPR